MGDNSGPRRLFDKSFVIPRSESKLMAGQKRGFVEVGERSELGHKRVKMKDLETVFRSEARMDINHTKSWVNRQSTDICRVAEKEMFQTNKKSLALNLDVTESSELKKDRLQPVGNSAFITFDLNAKVDMGNDTTPTCVDNTNNLNSISKLNIDKSRGFGFDLNVEDVSSSANHDPICPNKHIEQLRLRDESECGSTCGPLEDKDPMKVWKEMKQNGFMSSSHGGVPIPKPRGRKSKADGLKKKMEIARREQVDRFAKVAAPSGLLNGLNPGIINHVRNSRQVHSIIEALVRSERRDNVHAGNKEEKIQMKTEKIESSDRKNRGNLNITGVKTYNFSYGDGSIGDASRTRKTSNFPTSSENIRGNNDSSMNISTLCDEDSTDLSSVSSLSFKAADVASQWLELLHQDIKGRLAALRRSKRRVLAVIQTELPLLISRELSHNQENDPYVAQNPVCNSSDNAPTDMHRARWAALFNQMENALSEEEIQLENWLNQVKEMQLQCDSGISQCTGAPGVQQLSTSENACRIENSKDSERVLAVRAAAAAFYSTCNFSQSTENLPCY